MAVAVAMAALVTACGPRSNDSDVEAAIAQLRRTDAAARYEAIVRFGALAPTEARRRALAGALADAAPEVRLMAAIVVVGDGATAPAEPPTAMQTHPVVPDRTPNPTSATRLSAMESIVAADPRFAGTLLFAALLAVESDDGRVRALRQRALAQWKANAPIDGATPCPERRRPR